MNNSPFVYGRLAQEDCFTDREGETASLVRDFNNLTNTIIISPRRWGKSSLVRCAGNLAVSGNSNLRVCYLDVFNVRSENEFYDKLAACVLKSTSSKAEELLATAMRYASSLVPSITIGDTLNQLKLEFGHKELKKSADEILDLAERIAADKRIDVVVCIDEFQRIASFDDSEAFQARLRSHWQLHKHVAYCLYGSRRHMMMDVFTNPNKPFYKFGKTIFLEKIAREKWPAFIMRKFKETGKTITESQCLQIAELVDDNPYYIQQLSEEVWNRTVRVCEDKAIEDAFNSIVRLNSGLNLSLTSVLTISQQNLLNAIVNGEKNLSSASVMDRYQLKNSLTVQRVKKSLVNLDIIDDFGRVVTMEDPIYAYWLKTIYFNRTL